MTDQASTYIHKIKCAACGLHYVAYSWKEDWKPTWCPECGTKNGPLMHWLEESDQFIFQFVPGQASLIEMSMSGHE